MTVTSQETGVSQGAVTDDSGVYSVTRLAPGLYKVTAEKAGFKTKVVDNVQLTPERTNSLNVNLEVGEVTESVNVNGTDLPAIDTESAMISGTVGSRQIQALPSFGRDVYQLTQLAPGVFGDGAQQGVFVQEAPWSARPSYNFHNFWDFLNDSPYQENGTFDPTMGIPAAFRKDTRANLFGFFVQDSWKVKPNFTLTLGLRWEYFGPLSEKNGNLSTLELGNSTANAPTGLCFRKGGDLYNAQAANFGLQIGFAWSPNSTFNHDVGSQLVIRGGFGIGYTGEEEAIP